MFDEDLSEQKIYYGNQINETLYWLWNHFEGVDGLMGNEYFRNKILVIDAKANKIGFATLPQ
jgi:hypothetical protein